MGLFHKKASSSFSSVSSFPCHWFLQSLQLPQSQTYQCQWSLDVFCSSSANPISPGTPVFFPLVAVSIEITLYLSIYLSILVFVYLSLLHFLFLSVSPVLLLPVLCTTRFFHSRKLRGLERRRGLSSYCSCPPGEETLFLSRSRDEDGKKSRGTCGVSELGC